MIRNAATKCTETQTSCNQCGTCCTNGGAALHSEDLVLLQDLKILRSDIITLRRGEFAHNPVKDKIEAISSDIIKLGGTGGEWACCYFNSNNNSCGIYENRPIACRTLKCWEPEKSLALAGNDLLERKTILQNEQVLFQLVMQYEKEFLLPDFTALPGNIKIDKKQTIRRLEAMINADLAFRDEQVQLSSQVQNEELFLFGRPLFQLLQPFGLNVFQKGGHLCLRTK